MTQSVPERLVECCECFQVRRCVLVGRNREAMCAPCRKAWWRRWGAAMSELLGRRLTLLDVIGDWPADADEPMP